MSAEIPRRNAAGTAGHGPSHSPVTNRDHHATQGAEIAESRFPYLDSAPTLVSPRALLTSELVRRLQPFEPIAYLVCVTVTQRPGEEIGPTLANWSERTLGGWFVEVVTSTGAKHSHGFLLVEDIVQAEALAAEHAETCRLDHEAQDVRPLEQWHTHRMRKGVYGWTGYALAVDRYAYKRTRPDWEIPVAGASWGALEGTDELSRFAYADRDALLALQFGHAAPSPTVKLCECGCRKPVPPGRRMFADDTHGARARKRRQRRRERQTAEGEGK